MEEVLACITSMGNHAAQGLHRTGAEGCTYLAAYKHVLTSLCTFI